MTEPVSGGRSVIEKVPSAFVVTAGSVVLEPSARLRVTVTVWAPGAAPSESVSRPVSVSGSSAFVVAGPVRLTDEVGSVAPATRHSRTRLYQSVSSPKTSPPENAREPATR